MMKNLLLKLSTPETVETCVQQAPQLPGLPAPICLDIPGHEGAVWVLAGEEAAQRIIACVNSCNDLATADLMSVEVRHVIANLMTRNEKLLYLLGQLTRNAFKIEHNSFHLQGHEEFDPEAVLEVAKEYIAEAEATKVKIAELTGVPA